MTECWVSRPVRDVPASLDFGRETTVARAFFSSARRTHHSVLVKPASDAQFQTTSGATLVSACTALCSFPRRHQEELRSEGVKPASDAGAKNPEGRMESSIPHLKAHPAQGLQPVWIVRRVTTKVFSPVLQSRFTPFGKLRWFHSA